ncbi:MAG: LuxR C-terminal-related transcriptional regulator [bacterium]
MRLSPGPRSPFLRLLGTACIAVAVAALATPALAAQTIDLRNWAPGDDGPASLAGDWEIHWERLVSPEDLVENAHGAPQSDGTIRLPSTWNEWPPGPEAVGGRGYATMTATVLLPEGFTEGSLLVPNASTAYRLWANGELVAENGEPGRTRDETVPAYRIETARFSAASGELDLVLQVANFHHRRGGMWKPIRIGPAEDVHSRITVETLYDLLLLVSFLAMAIYNFALYRMSGSRTPTPLFLALVFIALAVRIPVVGQMVFTKLFVGFPWALQLTVEYLTGHAALAAFVWVFRSIYPRLVPKAFAVAVSVFAGVNAIAAVGLGIPLYSRFVPVYGYTMVGIIFLVAARLFIRALRRGRDAWLGFAAAAVTLLMSAAEQLHYQEFLLSREFAPFAFLVPLLSRGAASGSTVYVVSTSINLVLLFVLANLMIMRGSRALVRVAHLQLVPPQQRPSQDVQAGLKAEFGITGREAEIIALVAKGHTNAQIGEELFISEATVKTHMYRIMRKLGAESRNAVARLYLERAWGGRDSG